MKTATTTTSIIVQRREEDQDCDAKEKKINDTVLWGPVCQPVVSLAVVFSIVTQRSSRGALRDDTKNGCEGD